MRSYQCVLLDMYEVRKHSIQPAGHHHKLELTHKCRMQMQSAQVTARNASLHD
jgi:hypothetical protein